MRLGGTPKMAAALAALGLVAAACSGNHNTASGPAGGSSGRVSTNVSSPTTAPGGGPMEAMVRLANRQVALIPLEEGTTTTLALTTDTGFRWFIRRVVDLIPDVDRYDLTAYVGEGFNIPLAQLFLDFGTLALYLLPWIILAYYLIKWREIAAPT